MSTSTNTLFYAALQRATVSSLFAIALFANKPSHALEPPSSDVELNYLKELHVQAESVNPQLTGILVGSLVNARQQADGINFFARLAETANDDDAVRYRTAQAVLRAANANNIFILKRRKWVEATIDLLDQSREAAPDNMLIRWMIGTTLAQLPKNFNQQDKALADLLWLQQRFDQIPRDGLGHGTEREVYYQLARLYQERGDDLLARQFISKSGYTGFQRENSIISQFAASAENGLTMGLPEVKEIVPERVFLASGFEMMDFYFVVSSNGKETISIDAGTRPISAERAHRAVLEHYPALPTITTVLVTHTHWDHVGGHSYFRSLNPEVKFVSRSNYHEQLAIIRTAEPHFDYFFSSDYSNENVADYLPDQTLVGDNTLDIGGTRVEAMSIDGGETADGLVFHLPKLGITFVGDMIMPFIGAPFANEGNPTGLITAINKLANFETGMLLHGHKPLTDIFNSMPRLQQLAETLEWLKLQVHQARGEALSLADIHQLNLIPDDVYTNAALQLPYMVLREGFINRLHKESTGYWQTNLDGMDYLSHEDIGDLLFNHLDVSAEKLESAMQGLVNTGRYDEALTLVRWSAEVYPNSKSWQQLRRDALLGLRNKYQFTNPFKFLIYSEVLGDGVSQFSHAGHSH